MCKVLFSCIPFHEEVWGLSAVSTCQVLFPPSLVAALASPLGDHPPPRACCCGVVLVEACLWIRLHQTSLALGPRWASPSLESWSWGERRKDGADSVQQQRPLKRLFIICYPHPQGCSASSPSQGPSISFSLDSESCSYTINAFFFLSFFFKPVTFLLAVTET